ncbi:MAG: hypothetical protein ACRECH_18215, partial [Nitrososphaerales archaeon]
MAFGVYGGGSPNYFDPNTALPAFSKGSSTSPSVSFSSSNGNDLVVSFMGDGHIADTVTYPSGFTGITTVTSGGWEYLAYKLYSTSQSNTAVSWGLSSSDSWATMVDAISGAGTGYDYSVNNGVTITSTSNWEGIYYKTPISNNIVIDGNAEPNAQQGYGIAVSTVVPNMGGGEPTQNGYFYTWNGWGTGGTGIVKENNGYTFIAGGNNMQYPVAIGTYYTLSGYWSGSSLINLADYGQQLSASDSTYSSSSYLYIGSWGSGSGNSWTTQWLRTRTPTPNNVMP